MKDNQDIEYFSEELRKIKEQVSEKGLTIIPTKLFINEKGWAKIDIAIARGKKLYDKRSDMSERDNEREMKKTLKDYNR